MEMKLITIQHDKSIGTINCETCYNCDVFDKGIIYDVDSFESSEQSDKSVILEF